MNNPERLIATSANVPVAPLHDFFGKLSQPPVFDRLKSYITWQVEVRKATAAGEEIPRMPVLYPVSINLDPTSVCNFQCDHCVDYEILNQKQQHNYNEMLLSISNLVENGLKSIIVMGGGEPTVFPKFTNLIRFLKEIGLQVAVVTNGSNNDKINEILDCLDEGDWVRLSLDAATDETFQKMHLPRKPITLEHICEGVLGFKDTIEEIKISNRKYRKPSFGFSFITNWEGTSNHLNVPLHSNIHEIADAAKLARDSGFDYISFKPMLERRGDIEIVDPTVTGDIDEMLSSLRNAVADAKQYETPDFRVVESTNLQILMTDTADQLREQPHTCHTMPWRGALIPSGYYTCPGYRGKSVAKAGDSDAFLSKQVSKTMDNLEIMLEQFGATHQCRNVTCLYQPANSRIEELISDIVEGRQSIDDVRPGQTIGNYFL